MEQCLKKSKDFIQHMLQQTKSREKGGYHRGQGVKDNSVSRLINTAGPAYSLTQLSWVFHPWPPGSFDLSIPQKTCFLEVLGTCCVLYKVKPWIWMSKVFLILLSIWIPSWLYYFKKMKELLCCPLASILLTEKSVWSYPGFFFCFLSLWKHAGSSLPSSFVSFAMYFSVYTLYLFRLEIHRPSNPETFSSLNTFFFS